MQLCYVDESGKAEKLCRDRPDQQPVFVVAGLAVPDQRLTELTHSWLDIKRRYNPSIAKKSGQGWLDAIKHETKGTRIRKAFRKGQTGRRRQNAIGVIDQTLLLLESTDCKLIGKAWILKLDHEIENPVGMYAAGLQFICGAFHAHLSTDERGMVLVDSQTHHHNHRLAHNLFTARFGRTPRYERLVDMPVFGHSENHAGLQIADFLCSALLAPIACSVYAGRYDGWNEHCGSDYLVLRDRFGERLQRLTYSWTDPQQSNKQKRSFVVSDPLSKRGERLMWGP